MDKPLVKPELTQGEGLILEQLLRGNKPISISDGRLIIWNSPKMMQGWYIARPFIIIEYLEKGIINLDALGNYDLALTKKQKYTKALKHLKKSLDRLGITE